MMSRLLGGSIRERRLRTASALAIGAGVLFAVFVVLLDPFEPIERTAADAQFDGKDGSANVVIVGIDDAALEEHGRLQEWPRSLHAEAIENLSAAGARVVVYDVLFADTSAEDAALAGAIEESGNVVLAVAGNGSPSETDDTLVFESFTLPAERLRASGAYLAHANLRPDSDGTVRRLPLEVMDAGGAGYISLDLAAAYLQFGREPPTKLEASDSFELFARTVPLEDAKSLRVNYVGGSERFTFVTFQSVLAESFEPADVRNKVVYVGFTAAGADIHSTPMLGSAHGVEVHANALDTLLRARFLRPAGDTITFLTIVALATIAGFIVPRWRLALGAATMAALAVTYFVAAAVTFDQGYILGFVSPIVGLAVSATVALGYREVSERASQRDLQELFGRYVSEEVARELVSRADQGHLTMGGDLREVTVLFADIRGFTPLSQRMEPGELVDLLNRDFEVILSQIMESRGIVNKFAGDAVMAFWNAPEDQPGHAKLACRAALEAQDALESETGKGRVAHWGFGINTGVALAGNVGSRRRLEYTLIGDAVNLSARLAQMAPAAEVWVGPGTYELVKEEIEAEELPPQQVKGMEAPVVAYRLKGGGIRTGGDTKAG
jgi:adenylate cyclase